jgi:hypothetical protein
MSTSTPTSYVADYYYTKSGLGTGSRTKIKGSVSQHLRGATTESAVLTYLRQKHPGYEIKLMGLEWK